MSTNTKYTPEQENQISQAYLSGQTVEAIASSLGKTVKSIIAKLSRMGVYKAKARTAGGDKVIKADLVALIEGRYAVDAGTFADMEKLSKATLLALARED